MNSLTVERVQRAFVAELTQCRLNRGMTKKQLAREMGFDPSYVSSVERLRFPPTRAFARRASLILDSPPLWQQYLLFEAARGVPGERHERETEVNRASGDLLESSVLQIRQEVATLRYENNQYRCEIERRLVNSGAQPLISYRAVVAVDRFPGNSEWSNEYYRNHPLTLEEIDFKARLIQPLPRPMDWDLSEDRDSYKEITLKFSNADESFPIHPGQGAVIAYGFSVEETKWGPWFERAIRIPTEDLAVSLDFPRSAAAIVWGTEITLTADLPLKTPITERSMGERQIFEWSTKNPPVPSWYRVHWRFRHEPPQDKSDEGESAGRVIRNLVSRP